MMQNKTEKSKDKINTNGKFATVVIPNEIHKQLRIYAIQHDSTVVEAVSLVLKEYFKNSGADRENRIAG